MSQIQLLLLGLSKFKFVFLEMSFSFSQQRESVYAVNIIFQELALCTSYVMNQNWSFLGIFGGFLLIMKKVSTFIHHIQNCRKYHSILNLDSEGASPNLD